MTLDGSDKYETENEYSGNSEYMTPGCLFPEYCVMPGFHYKHECHTSEMLEVYYEDDEPLSDKDRELVERSWQEFKGRIEHVDRIMQVALDPKPGEPIAWIDGEPVYRKEEGDHE